MIGDDGFLTAYFLHGITAFLAVPFLLKWIGPNRIFGFRTAKTAASEEAWYFVHVKLGWALLFSAGIGIAVTALGGQMGLTLDPQLIAILFGLGPLVAVVLFFMVRWKSLLF